MKSFRVRRQSKLRFRTGTALIPLIMIAGACASSRVSQSVTQSVDDSVETEALRLNTLGVAYMNLQRVEDALGAFRQSSELDPNFYAARLNEAIALFNVQRFDEAEAILLGLTGDRPDEVRAWYNLGLVYRNTGRSEEAAVAFREATRIDPEDPDAWYLLGLMRAQLTEYPGAVTAYERAISLYPFHASAQFGLANVYQRQRQIENAQVYFAEFQRIETENLGAPMGAGYGDQGPYSLALDSTGVNQRPLDAVAVQFTPVNLGFDVTHSRSESGLIASYLGSGACFLDFDVDGRSDLVVQNGVAQPTLLHNLGNGDFETVQGAFDPVPTDGTGCTTGDYDNDGDVDIALSFGTGVRLFQNDGTGRFSDVSDDADIAIDGPTLGLTFIDFDHDGDLDLYAARFTDLAWDGADPPVLPSDRDGPGNTLWRNNGNGTFTDWTGETALGTDAPGIAAVGSDLNNDRAIDFVTTGAASGPAVFLNPREGEFLTPGWGGGASAPPIGVAVIDFDKDGWMDLAFTHWGGPGLTLWRNLEGQGFEEVDIPEPEWQRGWGIVALDFDNDGWMDLAAAGQSDDSGQLRVLRNMGTDGFRDVTGNLGLMALALDQPRALITADHDADGDADLFLTQNSGPLVVLRNDGGNQNEWLHLTFEGLNDNRSAIGTKVEVFAGTHRQKIELSAGSGYLGQSSLFLTAGLGRNSNVDTVRMLWPTGVIQDEIQLATREAHDILEIDRRGSSCPVLFAWNGREYEFITDIIGAGIVGHWVGPGQRNVSDPTEYVRVPASSVATKDGLLSFRLVEPMEELVYLDQVRLLAVDHPRDVEVYPHEYFAGVPPFPEFELIVSGDRRLPLGAWDSDGNDVLMALSRRDGQYVASLTPTNFKGFVEPHTLELDLGAIDADAPLRLLMHGYVDYFSATSVYAAHQAGVTALLPYVEALDENGNWIRVVDDLGFPAGLIRTMARDITGRLPAGTERIRITTNLKVYWDQILLDTTTAESDVQITEVPLARAVLDWHGYPRAMPGSLPSDVRYVYEDVSPTGPYARHTGYYTDFGDVAGLTGAADDQFVIFGSGEEVAVEFDPSDLPPLREGWTRDYIFYADGFAKDMDFYEAHSSTVGPLPFHTEEPYPYGSGTAYPTGPEYLEYRMRANTRASSGSTAASARGIAGPSYRFDYPE